MITKPGTVTVKADNIVVDGFTFSGVDKEQGAIEALTWALNRIHDMLVVETIRQFHPELHAYQKGLKEQEVKDEV